MKENKETRYEVKFVASMTDEEVRNNESRIVKGSFLNGSI